MTAMLISESFATWISDSWASTKHPLAGRHSTFLNVSKPENAFPEHQQIKLIAGQHKQYFKRFAPWKSYTWASANRPFCRMVLRLSDRFATWKCYSWKSANRHPCSSAQSIPERFAAWKQNSWISANRPYKRTALHISERFEALNGDSWESAIQSPFMTALPTFERFESWIIDNLISAN